MKALKSIYYVFDKLEDVIRGSLSQHPFIYTFVGGTGVVLFWRGVWHSADILESFGGNFSTAFSPVGSLFLGMTILLATGLFVSIFVGDSIIMSGIKKEKKVIDKSIDDMEEEKIKTEDTLEMIRELKQEIESLEKEAHNHVHPN